MFTLVCFSSPQPAYTLVDYLSSQHISGVVSKSEEQYCVELVNEADMAQAQIITAHLIYYLCKLLNASFFFFFFFFFFIK